MTYILIDGNWNNFFLPYSQSYVNLFNKKKLIKPNDISCLPMDLILQEDVRFHGFVDRNYVTLGQDFVVSFSFTNTGGAARTISAKMLCETVQYTGVRDRIIKQQSYQLPVSPRSSQLLHTNIVHYVISCCLIQLVFYFNKGYLHVHIQNKSTDIYSTNSCTDNWILCILKKNKGLIMTYSLLIQFLIN